MNNLLVGGAFLTLVTALWSHIQAASWKIVNCFVQYVDIGHADYNDAEAVLNKCIADFKFSPVYDRKFSSGIYYIRQKKRYGLVCYEKLGYSTMLFFTPWPLIYYVSVEKENRFAKLICLRWTVDVDRLISEACDKKNSDDWANADADSAVQSRYSVVQLPSGDVGGFSVTPSRFNTYSQVIVPKNYQPHEIGPEVNGHKKIDSLFYPMDVLDVFGEVVRWHRSKDAYNKLGIPWKRGLLLYGCGGSGKSVFATAIAHDLDMPIYVYRLADMTNFEFVKAWKEMLQHTPCVALFEDIDNVFHGRKNISQGGGFDAMFSRIRPGKKEKEKDDDADFHERFGRSVNFDVLLNCIDGVDRSEGVLTIITTNDLSKIDPALGQPVEGGGFVSTRPGRIDKAVHLTYMVPEVKARMATHFLNDYPNLLADVLEEIHVADRQETPAQFQERIGQMALKEYWSVAS